MRAVHLANPKSITISDSWGDATTPWGKTRIADGHPEPYKIRYIELGNVSAPVTSCTLASTSRSYLASVHEDSSDAPRAAVCREQEQYNTLYPAQVKAMEERATKIGKPKFFY